MRYPIVNPSKSNELLIIFARGVSDFGAFLNMVALSTYVYMLSESVVHVSIFLASRVSGGIVASLIGTRFFKRFKGRGALVGMDVLRAVVLTALLLVPQEKQLPILPVVAFALVLANSLFAIGVNSQLPVWVNRNRLVTTVAWVTSAAATGAVLGSLVSGLLIAGLGFKAVFVVNILTYLIAASMLLPLQTLHPFTPSVNGGGKEWQRLRDGLRLAPTLAIMLVISLLDTLGSGAHNVGFPIFSKLLGADTASQNLGYMLSVWAVGKFAGARLAARILQDGDSARMQRFFFAGVGLMSSAFILTFNQTAIIPALLIVVWAGLGDGVSEVALTSRIQMEPDSFRLPLFSVLTLVQMVGFGIGMLIVMPFFMAWTPGQVVGLFHGLPLAALVIALVWRQQLRASGRPVA